MSVLLAIITVVVFAVLVERLHVTSNVRRAVREASASVSTLRDAALNEREKERVLQRHSLMLFLLAGKISVLCLIALLVPLLSVWFLDRLGVAVFTDVLAVLQRVDFLLAVSVVGVLFLIMSRVLGEG